MNGIPQDLDQKISAMLDEVLDEKEQVNLQRELLKDQQANAAMLQMKQANSDAGLVIRDVVAHSGHTRILPQQLHAEPQTIHFPFKAMRYSAMAAGVMLVALMLYQLVPLGTWGAGNSNNNDGMHAMGVTPKVEPVEIAKPVEFAPETVEAEIVYAMDEIVFGQLLPGEAMIERDIERSFFGYYDEVKQKFYWLETEETIEEVNTIELDI